MVETAKLNECLYTAPWSGFDTPLGTDRHCMRNALACSRKGWGESIIIGAA